MAKRYIRINFQNTPSTATPLSAEFLNKMDKGIDDIDNAVELKIDKTSIVQTTATNDSTKIPSSAVTYGLQQSVDTLNNKLATNNITGNITNEANTSSNSSTLKIKDDIVDFNMTFSYDNAIQAGAWIKVMTLPTLARPINNYYGLIYSGANIANFTISVDGSVSIRCHVALTAGNYFAGHATYIK